MHLDLQWTRLTPAMLLKLASGLNEISDKSPIRNLKLGYNSLCRDENNEVDFETSDKYIQIMKTFIAESQLLTHLDMSGMNLSQDWAVVIASACSQSETLICVHLSDNGIRYDQDWCEEMIDCFGLNPLHIWPEQELGGRFTFNMKTLDPVWLREFITESLLTLDKQEKFEKVNKDQNSVAYQRHIIKSK